MKKFLGLILGTSALVAIALTIPAAAISSPDKAGPTMGDEAPAEGYACKGDTSKVPAAYVGAYKKACEAAKTEGKKPVRKMMGSMKNSLKKKCNKTAPEGKKFKMGCKSCHTGAGKAGNTTAAKVKAAAACDKSLLVDK